MGICGKYLCEVRSPFSLGPEGPTREVGEPSPLRHDPGFPSPSVGWRGGLCPTPLSHLGRLEEGKSARPWPRSEVASRGQGPVRAVAGAHCPLSSRGDTVRNGRIRR